MVLFPSVLEAWGPDAWLVRASWLCHTMNDMTELQERGRGLEARQPVCREGPGMFFMLTAVWGTASEPGKLCSSLLRAVPTMA